MSKLALNCLTNCSSTGPGDSVNCGALAGSFERGIVEAPDGALGFVARGSVASEPSGDGFPFAIGGLNGSASGAEALVVGAGTTSFGCALRARANQAVGRRAGRPDRVEQQHDQE